ncbi:MAG: hypothetical protein LBR11_05875 [Deltaproteobacteria bacterium]|jgi:transposase-like protein|nr:hypothetical protein [Deltaproteobacteria bacterium]
MANVRKYYSSDFKFKVATAAVAGEKTLAELSAKFGVPAPEKSRWKKQLLTNGPTLFDKKSDPSQLSPDRQVQELRLIMAKQAIMLEEMKKNCPTDPRGKAGFSVPSPTSPRKKTSL